jgi:CRISPR-associated endonuclease Csy4
MKYYIEISLLPSINISLGFLWEKMFSRIHMELVKIKGLDEKVQIGLGFPKYQSKDFPLGDKLRIFALSLSDLREFNPKFDGLEDYIHFSEIRDVPKKVNNFSRFERIQFKTSGERLARRDIKRLNISYEQAINKYKNYKERLAKTPFINIQSQSTGKRFCLFIKKQKCSFPVYKKFGTYGLSKTSTVPEF